VGEMLASSRTVSCYGDSTVLFPRPFSSYPERSPLFLPGLPTHPFVRYDNDQTISLSSGPKMARGWRYSADNFFLPPETFFLGLFSLAVVVF